MGRWRRKGLEPGIYDELVSERLQQEIDRLDSTKWSVRRRDLTKKEDVRAPVTALLNEAIDLALAELRDKPVEAVALAEEVLGVLRKHAQRTFTHESELNLRRERLEGIVAMGSSDLTAPKSSLHVSRLIVNAANESLLDHLRSEFETADRIDLLCAFVKVSGFEKFRRELELHCVSRARPLRVLTTTYMGASDGKAVERFANLSNARVKVSFDEAVTRLHAKAWIFHRASGYSTAYVGSSNLSHAAQTEGLEWNVRIAESDQPAVLAQMVETFEQYWADDDQFEPFDPSIEHHKARLARALTDRSGASFTDVIEIEPKDFQKPVLNELMEARRLGRHRNLLVAATGTGKTVMAALDYRALREAGRVDSLLFVAHRREILEQARRTFRHAMSSQTFGELLFEGARPQAWRHVFASVDSLSEAIDVARYDMVIIDEAHHSAAGSWERLLERVKPKELLGLTGTPERADGLNYEVHFPRPWVGNLRVWNAIPHALVPFRYYMLDVGGVDLSDVAFRNGRYAPEELNGKLITAAEIFVKRAVKAVADHVARPDQLKAIAFCSSVRHAEEVCRQLQAHGVKASVLTGDTADSTRSRAKDDLDSGRVQVLCVVDIYNEGVDIPNVNTLFFFRPTESATVFLQQLGRGLRRTRQKAELVVFDLTGRQNLKFRFDQRLRAALGHTPRELRTFVETGFGRLPAGCHFHFDEVARESVLEQLERAIPADIRGLRRLLDDPQHRELSLEQFLEQTEVDLGTLYAKGRSWTSLRRDVGLATLPMVGDEEKTLAALHRLVHVGDEDRLATWERLVRLERPVEERTLRIMRMLFVVLYGKETAAHDAQAWARWSAEQAVRAEVASLIPVLQRKNAVFAAPDVLDAVIPLRLHGRYLGQEISAAFDDRSTSNTFRDYYTGVEPVVGGRFDLLLVTMEKGAATKEHLRYRDFPLHDRRFHWQSKARTKRDEPQGRRHLSPEKEQCIPLLFVRERDEDRPGVTMAFRYLGSVRPDGDSGERPITIEWELQHPMPHDLLEAGRIAG